MSHYQKKTEIEKEWERLQKESQKCSIHNGKFKPCHGLRNSLSSPLLKRLTERLICEFDLCPHCNENLQAIVNELKELAKKERS